MRDEVNALRHIVLGIALLLLLFYLGHPISAQENVLNIGYQPSTHQVAEMVAMEKGWWSEDLKAFGITEIKEYEFPSGPPEMQAMLAGNLDVAYVGTAPPISAIDKGMDAKIVAGVNTQGSNLVLRSGLKYEGPESLIGLTIASFPPGSIQDIVFRKWLKDNGIEPLDVKIAPMGPGDAVTAISASKVDGVFLPHPSPAIIESEGRGNSTVSSGEMWPDHACCSIVVSGKLMRENPDLVKQIIRTHIRATEYINKHPDEAAEIYAERTGQDLDQVKRSIDEWDGKWISDPNIQVSSTVEYASIDFELNYTDRELQELDLFDTSFYDSLV